MSNIKLIRPKIKALLLMTMLFTIKKSPKAPSRSLRFWAPALSVIALSFLCFILQSYDYLWDYQKSAISNGEVWRLLTGHFSHTNGFHLLLNIAAIVLLNAIHGHFYRVPNILVLFVFSALVVSTGLYFTSEITRHVGLSGILHGLFVWGSLKDIQNKEKTGLWLFLGIWVKVIYEQINGPSSEVAQLIDANVAIDAHLWGAIAGVLYFAVSFIYRSFTNREK